jgi:hypothetical protein
MTDTQIEQGARTVAAALVAPILWATLAVFGYLPAMPWSPLGSTTTDSSVSHLFNPNSRLDNSRMGDTP